MEMSSELETFYTRTKERCGQPRAEKVKSFLEQVTVTYGEAIGEEVLQSLQAVEDLNDVDPYVILKRVRNELLVGEIDYFIESEGKHFVT